MRFNPPPNWPPAPPGWTPQPDWRPDPSWPPLPPGWPLWVPDAQRSKTGLVIGAFALTLLVGIGVVIGVVVWSNDWTDITVAPSTTSSPAPPQPTDEDLVRDVVDQFEKAWNDEDFTALTKLFCEDMRNDPAFSRSALREVRDTGGELLLKITSLDVDGTTATATILNHGEDPDDIAFVREDGDWKWCES
ncbi:hypothetical protein CIW52_02245 [Mycolicibacterium sp. P9-64]|uniref:Rv0361 family membrane protein n=1 Tax=Mycolicibacterium sp. P9-64 TaxID=2024612 RepID=UPI0011ED0DD6|nr:hypothetical protein [Mycolicibacterium sp. P9-64]KAA0086752.1 hypothetical protein CIW52_02245 [Mycolicibacterium sp. P9-64]